VCIFRATVSAVSCPVVPVFICIYLLISCVLKLNDDDDEPDQTACYQRTENVYIVDNRVSFKIALPDSPHPIISFKNLLIPGISSPQIK